MIGRYVEQPCAGPLCASATSSRYSGEQPPSGVAQSRSLIGIVDSFGVLSQSGQPVVDDPGGEDVVLEPGAPGEVVVDERQDEVDLGVAGHCQWEPLRFGDRGVGARHELVRLDVERPGEQARRALAGHVDASFQVRGAARDMAMRELSCSWVRPAATRRSLILLEAIRVVDPDIRLYQASSSEMFGDDAAAPQHEGTPIAPRSPYGAAKADALWGFAGDYVEAMWAMLQRDEPGDYVVATGQAHSVEELVAPAFAHAGLAWTDHVVRDERLTRPTDIEALTGDATKARAELGWAPRTSFEQLVALMVDHDLAQRTGEPRDDASAGTEAPSTGD